MTVSIFNFDIFSSARLYDFNFREVLLQEVNILNKVAYKPCLYFGAIFVTFVDVSINRYIISEVEFIEFVFVFWRRECTMQVQQIEKLIVSC